MNAGFLVGHCALRRTVMGDDAVGVEASDEQIVQMKTLLRESLEAGAIGYLFKDAEEEELISAIRMAGDGKGVVAREAMQALLHRSDDDYGVRLTEREQEILARLDAVLDGLTPLPPDESVPPIRPEVREQLRELGYLE